MVKKIVRRFGMTQSKNRIRVMGLLNITTTTTAGSYSSRAGQIESVKMGALQSLKCLLEEIESLTTLQTEEPNSLGAIMLEVNESDYDLLLKSRHIKSILSEEELCRQIMPAPFNYYYELSESGKILYCLYPQ